MLLPALLVVGILIYYPLLQGFLFSTREWDGYSPAWIEVGTAKFERLFSDGNFWIVLRNTLIYGFGSTLLQTLLGLSFALLFDRESRSAKLMRTIIYLPVIISPLIMGYIWQLFFRYSGGGLNDLVMALGFEPQNWLMEGMSGVWFITLVNALQFCGVAMVIFLAGLQAIPQDSLEAATIDGAGAWKVFTKVKLPLLLPAITTSTVVNLIGGLQLFDAVVALTRGGPGFMSASISTMIRDTYFVRADAGYASAMGVVMFVLILLVTLVSLRFFSKREVQL